jgi:hypothetical protein
MVHMLILDRLKSGQLHDEARKDRPDCVCSRGNIHSSPERAAFVSWVNDQSDSYGADVKGWPKSGRHEYRKRYVQLHHKNARP